MLLEGYLKNYATLMFYKKTRTELNFRDQAWNRPTTKCWVKDFILPHKHDAQILIEGSGNLKHSINVRSISNTKVSHLVSCRVIPRPATMKQ